ncbi:MAG: DUF4177 domain-containing protein [Firmicutes bacterium]|nr:DUF4177 domain-containing protein [Bacillota bacterium]
MYEYSVKVIDVVGAENIMNEMAKEGWRVKSVVSHGRNNFKVTVVFEKKNGEQA